MPAARQKSTSIAQCPAPTAGYSIPPTRPEGAKVEVRVTERLPELLVGKSSDVAVGIVRWSLARIDAAGGNSGCNASDELYCIDQ